MKRFALPPVLHPIEAGYEAERARARSEKILASMEMRLNGRPNVGRRQVLSTRPARADNAYDPRRW